MLYTLLKLVSECLKIKIIFFFNIFLTVSWVSNTVIYIIFVTVAYYRRHYTQRVQTFKMQVVLLPKDKTKEKSIFQK